MSGPGPRSIIVAGAVFVDVWGYKAYVRYPAIPTPRTSRVDVLRPIIRMPPFRAILGREIAKRLLSDFCKIAGVIPCLLVIFFPPTTKAQIGQTAIYGTVMVLPSHTSTPFRNIHESVRVFVFGSPVDNFFLRGVFFFFFFF